LYVGGQADDLSAAPASVRERCTTATVPPMDNQGGDRLGGAQALLASLGLGHYENLPLHVVFRMAALVAGEPIVFGDVRVDDDNRRVTGEAVAFTATRVIYAAFTDSQLHDEPARGEGTVDCRTRSRSDLRSVGAELQDGDPDSDYAWHNDWGSVVPTRSQLTLRYDDDLVLRLPCRPDQGRAARLDAFLPSLLSDL
jgi:hypothetical protein